MGYVVRMPQLGMTMEEGIVVEWCVDPDEEFEEGDTIIVIESEKTANEIDAREAGVLIKRFVELHETVEPGAPIAYVGEPGESVPADVEEAVAGDVSGQQASTDSETIDGATAAPSTTGRAGASGETATRTKVSPRARSYAAEHDVSVEGINGTGPDGAVIEQDVIDAAERGTTGPTGVSAEGRGIVEERTGSQLRRTIAKRMTASAQEAPQVTLNRRVEMDALLALKNRLATDLDQSLSLTDFLVAAVVEAVAEYPEFNAIYEDGVHKLASNVNVGLALDIDGGLVTPVLHSAAQLTLTELNERRSTLVSRVLDGDYTGDDLSNGTITITNLGHFGVESFDPILNPPEVAILGVNALQTELDPETREPVEKLGLSLTFDHRAVDGADAARFLQAINDALTHPLRLLSLDRSASATSESGNAFERATADLDERTAKASHEGGMQASVRTHSFAWSADEPEGVGGTDTAPNPVEQFLGSLSACFTLMIANIAERRDVVIADVDVTVHATPEEGAIESIDIEVDVVSADDEQQVKRVVQTAERACYVSRAVSEDIERSLDITVRTP